MYRKEILTTFLIMLFCITGFTENTDKHPESFYIKKYHDYNKILFDKNSILSSPTLALSFLTVPNSDYRYYFLTMRDRSLIDSGKTTLQEIIDKNYQKETFDKSRCEYWHYTLYKFGYKIAKDSLSQNNIMVEDYIDDYKHYYFKGIKVEKSNASEIIFSNTGEFMGFDNLVYRYFSDDCDKKKINGYIVKKKILTEKEMHKKAESCLRKIINKKDCYNFKNICLLDVTFPEAIFTYEVSPYKMNSKNRIVITLDRYFGIIVHISCTMEKYEKKSISVYGSSIKEKIENFILERLN
jgi:hypothetical protein